MTKTTRARFGEWYQKRGQGWKSVVALYIVDVLGIWLTDALTFTGYVGPWFGLSPNWTLFALGTGALALGLGLWVWAGPGVTRMWTGFYLSLQTASLAFSVIVLVKGLGAFHAGEGGTVLFEDAVALWFMNMLVFTLWYWKLDAGGPHRRAHREEPHAADILFAQRSLDIPGYEGWQPRFIDYLFLAFTTGTEFGPTDTAFLSRRCKILAMLQAIISLSILAILAARAVNLIR